MSGRRSSTQTRPRCLRSAARHGANNGYTEKDIREAGLQEVRFRFDYRGTDVVVDSAEKTAGWRRQSPTVSATAPMSGSTSDSLRSATIGGRRADDRPLSNVA